MTSNPIPSHSFNMAQLRTLREAVTGKSEESLFQSDPQASRDADGMKDVIIMAPRSDGLFQSRDAKALAGDVKKDGAKQVDALKDVGVTARVDADTAQQLTHDGYLIYDDSPRQLLPDLPAAEAAPGKATPAEGSPVEMPKIDPVHLVHADAVHQAGYTGKGQTVAVIDSGFQHPGYKLAGWKDILTGSSKETDPVGHGTHVVSDVLKTAPNAKIVAIRVMNAKGQGRPSDIIRGIQWAIQQKQEGKLDIGTINMSLGGAPDGNPALDPIDRAVEAANRAGIEVVAAAGNSGPNAHTVGSPAEAPSALAVGSARGPHTLSTFSSRGPTDSGLTKPNVVAPGEFISGWDVPGSMLDRTARVVSTLRHMSGEQLKQLLEKKPVLIKALKLPKDILNDSPDQVAKVLKPKLPPIYLPEQGMLAAPGTSFASPLTAGVVADLRQAGDTNPDDLRKVIEDTADSMGSYTKNEQGSGFLDGQRALQVVENEQAGHSAA